MFEFLLVHGACHRSWVWAQVIPALQALGHGARAVDLTGQTLADYADVITDAVRGPTILVGHSAGGFAITMARSPQIIGRIYLCAYIPQIGLSVAQMRRAGPNPPLPFRRSDDGQSYGFESDLARPVFFHDVPPGAERPLCDDPIAPMETALDDLPQGPRAAIICTDDRAIPATYQRQMAAGIAIQADLPSGHAPFLSIPGALAACLVDLATRMRRG